MRSSIRTYRIPLLATYVRSPRTVHQPQNADRSQLVSAAYRAVGEPHSRWEPSND
jgi:hypothetical protein